MIGQTSVPPHSSTAHSLPASSRVVGCAPALASLQLSSAFRSLPLWQHCSEGSYSSRSQVTRTRFKLREVNQKAIRSVQEVEHVNSARKDRSSAGECRLADPVAQIDVGPLRRRARIESSEARTYTSEDNAVFPDALDKVFFFVFFFIIQWIHLLGAPWTGSSSTRDAG